tara:strand:+ start:1544 stop:2911 length:1368 start_codon:yes stop_codon:yes gene_type:complete
MVVPAQASESNNAMLDLTRSWTGFVAIAIFAAAYVLVILEDRLQLRKSKPVLLAAGLIWILIAFAYEHQLPEVVESAISHTFLEYAELFFFLLVAMTYINSMVERNVFKALRNWLVAKGFSYRLLFWLTGTLAFVLSPIADNLTTALVMGAVVLAVGDGKPQFVTVACVNIVVGANAGGSFSPFGDITTLMVWQKGVIEFWEFFDLFIPSLVNFVLPAFIMQFALPSGKPPATQVEEKVMKYGGPTIVGLFLLTIVTAVSVHNFLHIPPVFGMMTGLAYLEFYAFFLRRKSAASTDSTACLPCTECSTDDSTSFDVFDRIAHAEWDTLFFFYGIILAVGGLGFIGYLGMASGFMYGELGATNANILVGILSAIVDNIPVMFAVLTMNPEMPHVQWLLVTLTAGVGGSLLSIGSAAGVALMGQARGQYTFFSHLKWTPVIALGYGASIWVHLLINA